ncbi:MAG: ThuA domain-containing protein [Chloroflexi bacterium]|nr:MAG: ThuA domain-containing protein [Chloroflexota bacterium]
MSRSRFTLLTLLSGRSHDYTHIARPLIHSLERMHHFDIEVAGDLGALNEGRARVLLAASDVPLAGDQAAQLNEFVRRGGGVVLLHSTLAAWSEHDAVAEMAGWRLGGPAPLTELVVRVADHPVTERLSPEIRVEDELYVSEGPPAEANVLLRASWRYSDQVVA